MRHWVIAVVVSMLGACSIYGGGSDPGPDAGEPQTRCEAFCDYRAGFQPDTDIPACVNGCESTDCAGCCVLGPTPEWPACSADTCADVCDGEYSSDACGACCADSPDAWSCRPYDVM